MAAPFRANARGRTGWRLWVLLLSVCLISLATLAKYNYGLPRTSGSHWISQTCKIRESRRAAPVRQSCVQPRITVVRFERGTVRRVALRSDPPPGRVHFLSSAGLRSPPTLL